MFMQKLWAQPEEKTPARECDGGSAAQATSRIYQRRRPGAMRDGHCLLISAGANKSDSLTVPTLSQQKGSGSARDCDHPRRQFISPLGHCHAYVQLISIPSAALIFWDQTSTETMSWDPNKARVRLTHRAELSNNSSHPHVLSSHQAQFRAAAQKLGQLQNKFESQAQVTKGDIATLLRQGTIGLARAKAEGVIKDEIHTDLLQTLEMYLEVVLEQFSEIEKKYIDPRRVVQLLS